MNGVITLDKGFHGLLAQVANPGALRRIDCTAGRGRQAGQNAQQGGLANTIRPDQPHFAIIRNTRINTQEDIKVAIGLTDIGKR